jgi:hypothetical protein
MVANQERHWVAAFTFAGDIRTVLLHDIGVEINIAFFAQGVLVNVSCEHHLASS